MGVHCPLPFLLHGVLALKFFILPLCGVLCSNLSILFRTISFQRPVLSLSQNALPLRPILYLDINFVRV